MTMVAIWMPLTVTTSSFSSERYFGLLNSWLNAVTSRASSSGFRRITNVGEDMMYLDKNNVRNDRSYT